jgi:hypothetical protein
MKKFNWDKVNKTRLSNRKGTYSFEREQEHNVNLDNYWKTKFKDKYKKFFKMWDKEKSNFQ